MKQFLIFVIVILFASSVLADSKVENVELRLNVDGTIEIDPQGNVHDYAIETRLAPAIREHIDQRVRQWRFEPILVVGKPVIAKTRMRVQLLAVPDGKNYQLRVDGVHFGLAKAGGSTHRSPRYPEDALRAQLGARVVLVLQTNAQGRVTDIHPYQTSLTRLFRDNSANKWRRLFERAAMGAAEYWIYEPDEYIRKLPR